MAWTRRVWSDRPGESWPSITIAAQAIGCNRTAISDVLDRPQWTCHGRHWTTRPPEWAAAAVAETERRRAASVRCNPGRNGRVWNGTDVRTGKVYAGGREVTEREGATA